MPLDAPRHSVCNETVDPFTGRHHGGYHVLDSYLKTKAIQLAVPSEKEGAIRAAVNGLASECGLDADAVFQSVMEREKIIATGMGHGVAVPHAKIKGLKDFALTICRSEDAISYGALDSTPVRILVLLLSPEDKVKEHVKVIAELNKKMKFASLRQSILNAKSAAEIADAFNAGR